MLAARLTAGARAFGRRTLAAMVTGLVDGFDGGGLTVLHLERVTDGRHGRRLAVSLALRLLGLAMFVAISTNGQFVAVRVCYGTRAYGYLAGGTGGSGVGGGMWAVWRFFLLGRNGFD